MGGGYSMGVDIRRVCLKEVGSAWGTDSLDVLAGTFQGCTSIVTRSIGGGTSDRRSLGTEGHRGGQLFCGERREGQILSKKNSSGLQASLMGRGRIGGGVRNGRVRNAIGEMVKD